MASGKNLLLFPVSFQIRISILILFTNIFRCTFNHISNGGLKPTRTCFTPMKSSNNSLLIRVSNAAVKPRYRFSEALGTSYQNSTNVLKNDYAKVPAPHQVKKMFVIKPGTVDNNNNENIENNKNVPSAPHLVKKIIKQEADKTTKNEIIPPAPHLAKKMYVIKPETNNDNKAEQSSDKSKAEESKSLPLDHQTESKHVRNASQASTVDIAEKEANNCNGLDSSFASSELSIEENMSKQLQINDNSNSVIVDELKPFSIALRPKKVNEEKQKKNENNNSTEPLFSATASTDEQLKVAYPQSKNGFGMMSLALKDIAKEKENCFKKQLNGFKINGISNNMNSSSYFTDPIKNAKVQKAVSTGDKFFFKVRIIECNSPSQFKFQIETKVFNEMMENMK